MTMEEEYSWDWCLGCPHERENENPLSPSHKWMPISKATFKHLEKVTEKIHATVPSCRDPADVLQQQVPAVVHGESGWYNPTRLIGLCNDPDLTPERLNWYLGNKGFQAKENGIWRLTPLGLIHGKEYPYNTPSGHSEPRIAWRESVLYASGLKRAVPETQLALPARA